MARGELRAKKVLVVDDDPDWREFLRHALEDLGYEPVEASSGQEALARIHSDGDCRVMLLDLHMPGMNGEEVIRQLRGEGPQVVFLTNAGAHEVNRAVRDGAYYYLPKGASRDELGLLLHSLDHHV